MRSIKQAREDRGKGDPLNDAERACRHYSITPEEYWADPVAYPLPDRGTGLTGISQGTYSFIAPVIIFGSLATFIVGAIIKKLGR
ncbi:hypothetical protein KKH23_07565 [Patescibacteria group bacterium]|nr:hypothetical protein [Patescibacteria group bacterium]